MGRKLNPLEAFDLGGVKGDYSKSEIENARGIPESSIGRIAEALGLPIEAFSQPEKVNIEQYGLAEATASLSSAMSQDCLELLRAFTNIKDPEERRRFITIVQKIAQNQ